MSIQSQTPLFVDTGAFYARFDSDDENHSDAKELFEKIRKGTVPFRPLYTSRMVLSETATLLRMRLSHSKAVEALETIRNSELFRVKSLTEKQFEKTCSQFKQYNDQEISFVDHSNAVLADDLGIEHIFAFDSDFGTFDITPVPEGIHIP